MKTKAETPLKGYRSSIIAFILATAVGLILFSVVTQRAVESLAREKLMINVARQSEHFGEILDVNFQFLEGMADQIGKHGALNTQKNRDMVAAIKATTSIDHVALVEPDGSAHFETGQIKSIAYRDYFQKSMAGNLCLSNPVQSVLDQNNRVILSVPVPHNNSVIGVLCASYDMSTLSHIMFQDFFDGKGICIIIDETGNIVTMDDTSKIAKIQSTDNFFEFYGSWDFYGNDSLAEIHQAFQDHSEGVLKVLLPGDPASSRYIAYIPLVQKNWMMCYVIPVSFANARYAFIHKYELILNGYFLFLVLFLILRIAVIYYHDHKKLVHSAQTDGLTQVFNKKHTHYAIDAFLQTAPSGSEHAFLILDLDKFKTINDTYGHSVGDTILQRVGDFLRSQFRDDDIIGRIGGDEFIILMKQIDSRENALRRIETMLEEIRCIKHEELGGGHITFSVGVVFSPESGVTFKDLYLNADQALYQTKRGGRDHYTVWELA